MSLSLQAARFYEDVCAVPESNSGQLASEQTTGIYNSLLDQAKQKFSTDQAIIALPQAKAKSIRYRDLRVMAGQLSKAVEQQEMRRGN